MLCQTSEERSWRSEGVGLLLSLWQAHQILQEVKWKVQVLFP